MSFQQGLSGLNTAAKNLDVIGNNVANAGTVGFKGSVAQFADVYAASLAGSSGTAIGIGAKLQAVVQQFTQGNVTTTNNPLDVALNGKGFFRMSENGTISYTRNGQFQVDKDGFIVDSNGRNLTGYGVTEVPDPTDPTRILSVPNTGVEQNLRLDPNALSAPNPTGGSSGSGPGVEWIFNVDSRSTVPTVAFSSTLANPVPNPQSYNHSTSIPIYDSLGNSHTLSIYLRKTNNPNEWQMYGAVDGTRVGNVDLGAGMGNPVLLQFTSTGQLDPATGYNGGPPSPPTQIDINLTQVLADQGKPAGPVSPLSFNLNVESITQYGKSFSVSQARQDGYTSGQLSGYSISAQGALLARYSNGQSSTVGFVRLANFTNPNGLAPVGNNQWVETFASGQPIPGVPGDPGFGVSQSGAVEDSNVDLTAELVNMITAQRVYQANAQTIKTQDAVLNTLVNLR